MVNFTKLLKGYGFLKKIQGMNELKLNISLK